MRRVRSWLRFRHGLHVNRKKVHRIMRLLGWTMHQRANGMRPRVEKNRSAADEPNQRLATDNALDPSTT